MIPDPSQRPTLTVEEAGRHIGLGRSAAYEAVRRGELPVLRFGRRILVPTAALRRLLAVEEATPPVGDMNLRGTAAPISGRLFDDVQLGRQAQGDRHGPV